MPETESRRSPVTRCEDHAMRPSFFDVQMEQIAGVDVLIAANQGSGLQIAHPAKPEPAQDAAHRGPAQAGLLRDPQSGPALATQLLNVTYQLGRGGSMQPMRSRTAILQSG